MVVFILQYNGLYEQLQYDRSGVMMVPCGFVCADIDMASEEPAVWL